MLQTGKSFPVDTIFYHVKILFENKMTNTR